MLRGRHKDSTRRHTKSAKNGDFRVSSCRILVSTIDTVPNFCVCVDVCVPLRNPKKRISRFFGETIDCVAVCGAAKEQSKATSWCGSISDGDDVKMASSLSGDEVASSSSHNDGGTMELPPFNNPPWCPLLDLFVVPPASAGGCRLSLVLLLCCGLALTTTASTRSSGRRRVAGGRSLLLLQAAASVSQAVALRAEGRVGAADPFLVMK